MNGEKKVSKKPGARWDAVRKKLREPLRLLSERRRAKRRKGAEPDAWSALRERLAAIRAPDGALAELAEKWRLRELPRVLRSVGLRALREGVWTAAAFLCLRASPVFGARPFGFALLCAAPDHLPALLLGLIASALTVGAGGELLAASVIGAVGLRILVRCLIEPPADGRLSGAMFRESVYLRMATAAVAGFASGFGMLVSGGFLLYDLWGTVISTVSAPVSVLLFLPVFEGNERLIPAGQTETGRLLRGAARTALALTLCLGVRGLVWLGAAPIHAVITAATLWTARKRGLAGGMAVGALCGLLAGWQFAILYPVAAVLAWLLMNISILAAGAAVTVCGAVYGAVTRTPGTFLAIFPPQLVGVSVFCLLTRLGEISSPAPGDAGSLQRRGGAPVGAGEDGISGRVAGMSEAFGRIADVYEEFSRAQARPGLAELRDICDGVCDIYCPGCPRRVVCWEAEYEETLAMIGKMCVSLYENGKIDPAVLPRGVVSRCELLPELTSAIEFGADSLVRRRLADCRVEVLAHDTRAVARVLSAALVADRRNKTPDRGREKAVRAALDALGVRYACLTVAGSRRLRITATEVDFAAVSAGASDILTRLEYATGHRLTPLSLMPAREADGDAESGLFTLETHTRRKYEVIFAAARSAAEADGAGASVGDVPCGDVICRIPGTDPDGEGYFYAVLCDGMGTGEGAAAAARACCELLRRMLAADMDVAAALEMLNSLLRSSLGERSVGLDLLRVDLIDGSASLWKSGAAASYLRRGGCVRRLEACSVPVGILNDADAERKDFGLFSGDAVLLTSDGIDPSVSAEPDDPDAEDGEEDADDAPDGWLTALLREFDAGKGSRKEIQAAADEAVRRAVRHARLIGSRDDISAALVVLRQEK